MNWSSLYGFKKGDDVVIIVSANGYSENATEPSLIAKLIEDGYECIGEYDIADHPFNMENKGWPLEVPLRHLTARS